MEKNWAVVPEQDSKEGCGQHWEEVLGIKGQFLPCRVTSRGGLEEETGSSFPAELALQTWVMAQFCAGGQEGREQINF